MKYSFLIPVYNRPEEVDELLQSLTAQSFSDFEVIVVDDGSSLPCREVTERYAGRLDLHYPTTPPSVPGANTCSSSTRTSSCHPAIWKPSKQNCSANRAMPSAGPTVHTTRSLRCKRLSTTP